MGTTPGLSALGIDGGSPGASPDKCTVSLAERRPYGSRRPADGVAYAAKMNFRTRVPAWWKLLPLADLITY